MPVQKGQAKGLMAKLGNRVQQAHAKAKDKDTDFGNLGDLPPGINGGVAQVVDAKIDVVKEGKKHAGEFYYYIGAVVVTPKTFTDDKGVTSICEGMRTMITGPLHDTPERTGERKTFEQHWDNMLNELRKLGVDTKTMKPDDIDGVMESLRTIKPLTRFRTWMGKATPAFPTPRVNHEWGGLASDFSGAADQIGAVDDNSTDDTSAADQSNDDQQAADSSDLADGTPADVEDYEALGAQADSDDDAAQTRILELCAEVGITEAQIKAAPDYAALAALVAEKKGGGDTPAEPEGWKVGDTCKYAPKDPKDKKGVKRLKKVDCSVLEINGDGTEVTLKNLDDTKIKYKSVSVNEIEPA